MVVTQWLESWASQDRDATAHAAGVPSETSACQGDDELPGGGFTLPPDHWGGGESKGGAGQGQKGDLEQLSASAEHQPEASKAGLWGAPGRPGSPCGGPLQYKQGQGIGGEQGQKGKGKHPGHFTDA